MVGFILEVRYFYDPSFDFDDEYPKIYKLFSFCWGLLFCNYFQKINLVLSYLGCLVHRTGI